jgi:hypothetical protein
MSDDRGGKEDEFYAMDASAGLYHEAQADGVPYDEDLEPFSRDAQKHTRN